MFQGSLAKTLLILVVVFAAGPVKANAQAQRSPSDVVREFYKAMREHRFKEAWSMTVDKPAVEDLTAEEMEDLRPIFEGQAAKIPDQVEITSEKILGNVATVFVKVPVNESTPQITSEPINLLNSGGNWIIGTEADAAEVKKKGRRFFLDALIEANQNEIEDMLKRLIAVQVVYASQHNGAYGDLPGVIGMNLIDHEFAEPKEIGYNVKIAVAADGKSYIATAEPARYGHTGKLSFRMDQTGNIKKADNGGKPLPAN
jgi:hypothetical protein